MNKAGKIAIVVVLIVAVVVVIALKPDNKTKPGTGITEGPAKIVESPQAEGLEVVEDRPTKGLPRMVDLGADKCIPCKMMAPILEQLKSEYEGTLIVDFIDVWKNPDEGPKYNIKLIPTQIFFDASGKERFRHEGFFSKEDILAKWKELGVDLKSPPTFERQSRKGPNLLHVRPRYQCKNTRNGSDRQRAGPAVLAPLLFHNVLLPGGR